MKLLFDLVPIIKAGDRIEERNVTLKNTCLWHGIHRNHVLQEHHVLEE
jgi:hypothetical protein